MRRLFRPLLISLSLFLLMTLSAGAAAPTSSCVTCHTSESILKAMVKPPALGGEGEG